MSRSELRTGDRSQIVLGLCWGAVKELRLSYHTEYICIGVYMYIVIHMVLPSWQPFQVPFQQPRILVGYGASRKEIGSYRIKVEDAQKAQRPLTKEHTRNDTRSPKRLEVHP